MRVAEEFDCPKECGQRSCCVLCHLQHQSRCELWEAPVPVFSERWSGPNYPLTQAVLQEGIEVTPPFDVKVDAACDFFSEEGKSQWEALDQSSIAFEHHVPDCKTMSRSRGRPCWLDGSWVQGPPAPRDERNVMGFSHLRGENAVRVRQDNKMALKSFKRCMIATELVSFSRLSTLGEVGCGICGQWLSWRKLKDCSWQPLATAAMEARGKSGRLS